MEAWSLATMILCFGGGIISASLGAILSFVFCGFFVLAGCICVMAGGSDFFLLQVGLGPIFGPHVGGFAAAVAASTYADSIKGNHPAGAAKDILAMLTETSWDVLLIGGIFAILGHVFQQLIAMTPVLNMTDTVALAVVASNTLARLVFQKESPFGDPKSIQDCGLLGHRNHEISWVPWMAPFSRSMPIGFGQGIFSTAMAMGAYAYLAPLAKAGEISAASAFVAPLILGWVVGVFTFMPLLFGNSESNLKVPILHGMGIISALAYLQFGTAMPPAAALIMGGLVGMAFAVLQELAARMFYNHGSNHIDPPATAIAAGAFMINGLKHLIG